MPALTRDEAEQRIIVFLGKNGPAKMREIRAAIAPSSDMPTYRVIDRALQVLHAQETIVLLKGPRWTLAENRTQPCERCKGTGRVASWVEPGPLSNGEEPWGLFLHHRARLIEQWTKAGKTLEEVAKLVSADAAQIARIIEGLKSFPVSP